MNSARSHYANALQVKALYDYVPDSSFEGEFLTFKAGDVITVTEKNEGGWYKGLLNNKEALFPPTYCEELPPRRVMNVDTKKTSPTIKRMQTLLKLTVTGNDEKVEEVEQEVQEGLIFTRERAQSDAHAFAHSKTNSTGQPRMREVAQRVIEGRRLLEGRLAGLLEENGTEEISVGGQHYATDPVVRIAEPIVKDKPAESPETSELQKRIKDLENEKLAMVEEFKIGKEKLQDEFMQKVSLLHEMLDEKALIIEIMKKDLEIKAEENKEITIELELEIERLTHNCADLELQVAQLTPLALSPRDARAIALTPRARSSPSPSLRRSSSASPPPTSPASPDTSSSKPAEPTPVQSTTDILVTDNPSSSPGPVPVISSTPLSPIVSASPDTSQKLAKPVPSPSPSLASTAPPHPPQRFNSLPSLSPLPKDLKELRGSGTVSPRSSARPITPRMPSSPRILYTPTLLDSTGLPRDARSKIPNFDVSLAKLAELGAHPHAVPALDLSGSLDPAAEISELKKRIAELEAERLQMIEEYRHKKASETSTPPPSDSNATPPSSSIGTSTASLPPHPPSEVVLSTSSLPRPSTPIPTLQISSMTNSLKSSGNLPPVPLPPTSTALSTSTHPLPSVPSAPTSSASSSPSSSPFKPAQDTPPASSSLNARPTRHRNKERKDPSPSSSTNSRTNNSEREVSAKANGEEAKNLTWLQGSVCVAVGSVAFYLVQTIFHKYYA